MFIRQNFRIYPTFKQIETLNQWLGQGRFVWNYMLSKNIERYENEKKFIFAYDMNNLLPDLKKQTETSFLKEIPSQCLQQKCADLDTAIKNKFKHKRGFPRFKSKRTDESGIRFPSVKIEGKKLIIPKMKNGIRIVLHRDIIGTIGSTTISKDKTGAFYASILVKVDDSFLPSKTPIIETMVGVDVGLKEFAITSDGEFFGNPKFLRRMEPKIKKAARRHSKKTKGSKNKEKTRIKLARLHKKVSNQRKDFINKAAHSIVKSNDLIVIEDLSSNNMMKNHSLAKSIADVSWFQFKCALEWQSVKRGKHLVKIGRFFPSSKTCSCCGHKQDMPLDVRTFVCESCGFTLDRDINASMNILNEGIRLFKQNTAGTAEIHACGDMNCKTNETEQSVSLASSAQEAQLPCVVG